MLASLALSLLLGFEPQQQTSATDPPPASPNDPGILDPVRVTLLNSAWRIPATEQVVGDSELVNLVGKVKRKKARGSRSATGALIQDSRDVTRNIERSLEDLEEAAAAGDGADMRDAAALLRGFITGQSVGFISDGFPLLHHLQGGMAPDHVPGEYRMKRLQRSGHTFLDDEGNTRDFWEVTWRLLWTEAGAESDLALLVVPQDVHPEDRVLVHFEVYASAADEVGLMSFFRDSDLTTSDGLPFKGVDSTWVRLREDHIHEYSVDHGAAGALRELGMRGWRVRPEPLARVDLVHEIFDVHQQKFVLDPRGQALAAAGRLATLDRIGAAAPEAKVLQLADAVLAGANAAQVRAAMNSVATLPYGVWTDWAASIRDRRVLPREALDLLAQEGIVPGADRARPLGDYDFVAVAVNYEWYGLSAAGANAPYVAPEDRREAMPRAVRRLKVINLDDAQAGVQLVDYGPELHNDIGECYNAPHGGKSLEIFSDKPLYGAPKSDELQWRAGWGFRPGAGVITQYDLFPRALDQGATRRFRDSFGTWREGWQYPKRWRGGDFRVDPPTSLLGQPGRSPLHGLQEADGSAGLIIGRRTPGYGTAKMPTHDLRAFHPAGAVNTDTDGDQVPDALLFPDWQRNPDAQGGDLILRTPHWTPFLYLSPHHGGVHVDPSRPADGLWALETQALGAPVAGDSALTIDWMRPRGLGQAVWLDLGQLRAHGTLPLTMLY
jgi:hypothetical protein